jgi:spermidine synthase
LREFRLIFGTSTAATAAVLGIFMGGIGIGSIVLGRRSEKARNPLVFYAKLELLISVLVAVSPVLIWLVRRAYLGMGGTMALGIGVGTVIRLILATLVIGGPTFLMGGTLPAAARAVATADDSRRRSLALLYGANTLGAVAGVSLATFCFFERFGNHLTLWMAAALNILLALAAFYLAGTFPPVAPETKEVVVASPVARPSFVLGAAAVVGFAFLLMEMVWYRMLSPLLGGSTFAFGLILAVALFGIGSGGICYAFFGGRRRPSLQLFAFTCSFEALCLAVPFALGDRLATLAMLLQPLGTLGFGGRVGVWLVLCAIVVLPGAFVSGIQFPLLIGLLGRGNEKIGVQTGSAFACNTAGAIAGSLVGGFGLLPALTAPGCWSLITGLLCSLGVFAGFLAARTTRSTLRFVPSASAAVAAVLLLRATGPTAYWRHSQIGVGRVMQYGVSENELRNLIRMFQREVVWEAEGVESSVALSKSGNGIGFIVNGRCDGNAKGDAGTQVMCGLIGAVLHPKPASALVIGLGTGSTAGWLAAIPSVKKVDVFELEPAILRVAKACAAVNQNALENSKLHVTIGDARESLLTTREKYDLIASEPSNPYRAGVASLFTKEYYRAVSDRLHPGGLFMQWVQAYEVDLETIETVYATLHTVFPCVETYQTTTGDMLLVGSEQPNRYDVAALRERFAEEPFKSALKYVWHANDLEGFLAHYLANDAFGRELARRGEARINTDDHTLLEYAFARSASYGSKFQLAEVLVSASAFAMDRPATLNGTVDWESMNGQRFATLGSGPIPGIKLNADERWRGAASFQYAKGNLREAIGNWRGQAAQPKTLNDLLLVADSLAEVGDNAALPYIERLREMLPTEASAITARLRIQQKNWTAAKPALEEALAAFGHYPWTPQDMVTRTILAAKDLAQQNEEAALAMHRALSQPFVIYDHDDLRIRIQLMVGSVLDQGAYGRYSWPALEAEEPNVPWEAEFLHVREECYRRLDDPRAEQAHRDFVAFTKAAPSSFAKINIRLNDDAGRLSQAFPSDGLSRRNSQRPAP